MRVYAGCAGAAQGVPAVRREEFAQVTSTLALEYQDAHFVEK
jgi:hypothetical protein